MKIFKWSVLALVAFYLLLSVAVLPRMALRATDNPVLTSPSDVGAAYQDVSIPSDDIRLEGWWMPVASPRATLLFVHGAGSNRTSHFFGSLTFYKAMNDAGISVLTIDLRNHGDSPLTDGWLQMGRTEWRDVQASLNWLEQTTDNSVPKLVMGVSMGGATAIQAQANGVKADGWILLDPALNNVDALAQGGWISIGLPSWLFYTYASASVAFYGIPGPQEDGLAKARAIAQPMLLIQDPDDPITRAPFARALAASNPAVILREAPTVDPSAPCVNFKGRWGTHVAAFLCSPQWFMGEINDYVNQVVLANRLDRRMLSTSLEE